MPRTVLIIDDDPIQMELISAVLAERGQVEVATAEDGEQASKLLQTLGGELALVICDLNMPNRNGVELIEDLVRGAQSAPLLFVSGAPQVVLRSAEALAAARGIEVLGVMRKPVDAGELVVAVERALARRVATH